MFFSGSHQRHRTTPHKPATDKRHDIFISSQAGFSPPSIFFLFLTFPVSFHHRHTISQPPETYAATGQDLKAARAALEPEDLATWSSIDTEEGAAQASERGGLAG